MPYKNKEKQAEYQARWAKENRERLNQTNGYQTRQNWKIYLQAKSGPCVDCDMTYHYSMMQFDHIGTNKIIGVSRLVKSASAQRLLDEIAKCELVCANCHAYRTWQRSTRSC